jgi:hypothetical protein
MKQVSQEIAEHQVVRKYNKLYDSLLDLVTALNVLEPGGTLLDDIKFETKEDGTVRVSFVTTPIQLTVATKERTFILRVIEETGDRPKLSPSRPIMKRHKEIALA